MVRFLVLSCVYLLFQFLYFFFIFSFFFFFFFFFSSRRRHTRLTCDWSSDVCSSDLGTVLFVLNRTKPAAAPAAAAHVEPWIGRSEERRVGKECRSRWSPDQ